MRFSLWRRMELAEHRHGWIRPPTHLQSSHGSNLAGRRPSVGCARRRVAPVPPDHGKAQWPATMFLLARASVQHKLQRNNELHCRPRSSTLPHPRLPRTGIWQYKHIQSFRQRVQVNGTEHRQRSCCGRLSLRCCATALRSLVKGN